MGCNVYLNIEPKVVPQIMVKVFQVEVLNELGWWVAVVSKKNNYQR